jgi:hypothetical protein
VKGNEIMTRMADNTATCRRSAASRGPTQQSKTHQQQIAQIKTAKFVLQTCASVSKNIETGPAAATWEEKRCRNSDKPDNRGKLGDKNNCASAWSRILCDRKP